MAARDTYNASLANAAMAKAAADLKAEMVRQEQINAQGCNVGLTLQNGNATFVSTMKTANATYLNSLQTNEINKQTTIQVAKDVLKNTGDLGPT